jgi:hypothetical protein
MPGLKQEIKDKHMHDYIIASLRCIESHALVSLTLQETTFVNKACLLNPEYESFVTQVLFTMTSALNQDG